MMYNIVYRARWKKKFTPWSPPAFGYFLSRASCCLACCTHAMPQGKRVLYGREKGGKINELFDAWIRCSLFLTKNHPENFSKENRDFKNFILKFRKLKVTISHLLLFRSLKSTTKGTLCILTWYSYKLGVIFIKSHR